ncbi:MAG TPA: glycosyltransferase family 9 protein [Haliangiales bacterium]|nr:glycosyltransferase family 9 protein [Haliangiales bacterium]
MRTVALAPSLWFARRSRTTWGWRGLPRLFSRARGARDGWLDPAARKISLELRSDGAGDTVNLVPLVQEIAARHPGAELTVVTNHPEIPFPMCAPNVRSVDRVPPGQPRSCHLDLSPEVRYHLLCPHWLQYVLIAGLSSVTLRDDPFPLLGDEDGGLWARLGAEPFVLLHARNMRTAWEGRNTDAENFLFLVRRLRDAGYRVWGIGNDGEPQDEIPHLGRLTMVQLVHAVRRARGFVGVDSFPMHLAALYDKPILGYFGATYPFVVLTPVTRFVALRNEALSCNGCVYVTRPVGYNKCWFGDQRCGARLPDEYLERQLERFAPLLRDPDARIDEPRPDLLEQQLRAAQLLYEEALLIEDLRHRITIPAGLREMIRAMVSWDKT